MSQDASSIQIPSPRIDAIYSGKDEIVGLDLSPDGKYVAYVVRQFEEQSKLEVFESKQGVYTSSIFQSSSALTFSGDGTRLYFTDESQKIVRICLPEFQYLDRIQTRATDRILNLASSPDGKWLAYSDSSHKIGLISFGRKVDFQIDASYAGSRLCFLPDSQMIASYLPSVSKHVDLHELKSGAQPERRKMLDYTGPLSFTVSSMTFSSNSKELFVGSENGHLCFFWKKDVNHFKAPIFLICERVDNFFAEPTGQILLAGTRGGELIFVDITRPIVIHRTTVVGTPDHPTQILFTARDRSCQHLAVAVKYSGITENDKHKYAVYLLDFGAPSFGTGLNPPTPTCIWDEMPI